MMGERLRLCAACNTPSPGPTKRLYYQHRDYGPFFPILEDQRRKSNGCLFGGGRVVVCTACASHLLRQWAYYERNWTPLGKRFYTLLSEERLARKAKKENLMSKVSMGTNGDFAELNEQENYSLSHAAIASNGLNQDTMSDKVNSSSSKERLSALSFISEGNSPFRRAVKKVSKQNTRILAEYEANKHSDLSTLQTLEKSEQWNGEELTDSKKGRSLALWGLPSEDIRSKVREELQENIDVMIRKVAEIQHYENLKRYEHELKEAAERMCRVQDSKGDIDKMCQSLKSQLQEELLFRDTLRVLNEEEKDMNGGQKALISIEPPPTIKHKENHSKMRASKTSVTGVTNAKKAGKEWKGKSVRKKLREKAALSTTTETSLALVPCPTEENPGTSSRNDAERTRSASRKLDEVVRELENEREWRKTTENIIVQQREMIEELRKGIQGEVQRLIEEQNKRYHDIKSNAKSPRRQHGPGHRASPNGLSRPSHHKTPYISVERASSVDHDAMRDDEERMRSRDRRRPRKANSREQWVYKGDVPSAARSKKNDDDKNGDHDDDDDDDDEDGAGDVTEDSEGGRSSPVTPEYYIQ